MLGEEVAVSFLAPLVMKVVVKCGTHREWGELEEELECTSKREKKRFLDQ